MAITGVHGLLYTTEPEQLRALLRDVFGYPHVDAGEGWLIFGMPPAELGVHPAESPSWDNGTRHLISFMCDDINTTIGELRSKGISVSDGPKDEGYGITAVLNLPGGCDVMIYEPRHPIAAGMKAGAPRAIAGKKKSVSNRRPSVASVSSRRPSVARRAKKAARRR